jgi:predicted O-methyltransferase YrrM
MYDERLGKLVPEVAAPTPECQHPENWRCYDHMATEYEVLLFLSALVRMLKPKVCIETGTYQGHGTYFIATALRANGWGVLHTAEPDSGQRELANARVHRMGVESWVLLYANTGLGMIEMVQTPIDFAFLDSNIDTRIGEMVALLPRLTRSGVVAVHDTSTHHAQYNGPRVPFLHLAEREGLQAINFDTPRGLMLLRKKV